MSVLVRAQEDAFAAASGKCSCGATGKPFMTLDGRMGHVCERCFVKQLLVVTRASH